MVYCVVSYCIVLYCIVLYCIVSYCNLLYDIVLCLCRKVDAMLCFVTRGVTERESTISFDDDK